MTVDIAPNRHYGCHERRRGASRWARRPFCLRQAADGRSRPYLPMRLWHAVTPAAANSSATYRHPVHPYSANATSSRQANRTSQARRCSRSAGLIWPRRTSPVTVPGGVEGDLLPVNIQPAYDRHRDLLKLWGRARPPANCLRGQS